MNGFLLRQTETVFDPGRRGGVCTRRPDRRRHKRRWSSAVFPAGRRCGGKTGGCTGAQKAADTDGPANYYYYYHCGRNTAHARGPALSINTAFYTGRVPIPTRLVGRPLEKHDLAKERSSARPRSTSRVVHCGRPLSASSSRLQNSTGRRVPFGYIILWYTDGYFIYIYRYILYRYYYILKYR